MSVLYTIPCISNDGRGVSFFNIREVELKGANERMLSEQIPALNFRLRQSDGSYSSDWHVAGDPTLLIVLSGTIKIHLRNGDSKKFSSGETFIAEDYLDPAVAFDDSQHGHRAEVMDREGISVLHLKLEKRN